MDDWQMRNVLFCPRDDKGHPIGEPEETDTSEPKMFGYKATFWAWWKQRGKTEEEIQERWKAYLAENPDLDEQGNGKRDGNS